MLLLPRGIFTEFFLSGVVLVDVYPSFGRRVGKLIGRDANNWSVALVHFEEHEGHVALVHVVRPWEAHCPPEDGTGI